MNETKNSKSPFRCEKCGTTVWPEAPFGDGGHDGLHDRCRKWTAGAGTFGRPQGAKPQPFPRDANGNRV